MPTFRIFSPDKSAGGDVVGDLIEPASALAGLYVAPATVQGVGRTYGTETDEFAAATIDAKLAEVNGAELVPAWRAEGGAAIMQVAPTAGNGGLYGLMAPLVTDATPTYLETAIRNLPLALPAQMGIVLADGVEPGSGTQWIGGVQPQFAATENPGWRETLFTNWNQSGEESLAQIATGADMGSDVIYLRAVYDKGVPSLALEVSAGGEVFTLLTGLPARGIGFDPQFIGIGFVDRFVSEVEVFARFEYFRVYSENQE